MWPRYAALFDNSRGAGSGATGNNPTWYEEQPAPNCFRKGRSPVFRRPDPDIETTDIRMRKTGIQIRWIALMGCAVLAGCDRPNQGERDPLGVKPGLQGGEVYDSGGYSETNPITTTTNGIRHTEGTNSGVEGGPIRAP